MLQLRVIPVSVEGKTTGGKEHGVLPKQMSSVSTGWRRNSSRTHTDSPWCVFSDCCHNVQAQKEGSTKKLLLRALNCHCLLLKNTGRQDRYVISIEVIVVSLDCRKSSGDILGEIGT